MNLRDLKKAVDTAVESAMEKGDTPDEVTVSIQVDLDESPSACFEDVTLHYDGDVDVSGCVISGDESLH